MRGGGNPMEAKLFLAEAIVSRYHGSRVAKETRAQFTEVFSKGNLPKDIPGLRIRRGAWNPELLLVEGGLARSKSDARRLIMQRAVTIDGVLIRSPSEEIMVSEGTLIKVGRRGFGRVV